MTRTKANGSKRKPAEGAAARESGGLTDRQLRAIPAILEGPTIEAAARAAGVAKVTLYEWLKQDPFREKLEAARAELYRGAIDTLKGAAGKAARRLIELLDSRNENTRRLTAREVLALAMKIDDEQDLKRRVERLEEINAAEEGKSGTGTAPGQYSIGGRN